MAEKNQPAAKPKGQTKPAGKPQARKKESKGGVLVTLVTLFGLLAISGLGFAAGVYLNLIDLNKLNQTYKLYDYPVVGKYFSKPQTNFELVPDDETEETSPAAPPPAANSVVTAESAVKKEAPKVDLEKEMKSRQQEEQKRLTKLARLYSAMKAEEAASIIAQLEDDTVLALFSRMEEEQVAKILALMDAKRAARLSQDMLKVKSPVATKL